VGFHKTRHILLSDSANCTVLRAVVLIEYRRLTDGQTDGIAVASTALAMRRAVKRMANSSRVWVNDASAYRPIGAHSHRPLVTVDVFECV